MASIISLVEVQLTGGTVYWATQDQTLYDGNMYEGKLTRHPEVTYTLSDAYYGVAEINTAVIDTMNLDQSLTSDLRDAEARECVVIIRRSRDGAVTQRFAGKVESVTFAENGVVRIAAQDQAGQVLATNYPRITISPEFVGTVTNEQFAVGATVPVVIGAVREHVPCRYVEADELNSYYRYIVCTDFWPVYALADGDHRPLVRPYVNTAYWGLQQGVAVMSEGEYEIEWISNSPLWITAGFTTDPVLTTPNSGSMTGTYWYKVLAYNAFGLVATSNAVSTGSITSKKVTITWTEVHNASFYRVWGRPATEGGTYGVLATVCGHDTVTWEDDGSRTPYTAALPASAYEVPNWAGGEVSHPNFVSLIFRTWRLGASSQLAPVMADVEMTELGPTAYTKALWLFRNDTRQFAAGATLQQNLLRTKRHVHSWTFKQVFAGDAFCADSAGSQALSHNGVTASELVSNTHYGEQVLRLDGVSLGGTGPYADEPRHVYLARADSLDMEYDATTSFRVEVEARPGADTGGKNMRLCGKGVYYYGTITDGSAAVAGWALEIQGGLVSGVICDNVNQLTVTGTTPVSDAWHRFAMEVDRDAGQLRLYLDGELEATGDIYYYGSLVTGTATAMFGTFRIGLGLRWGTPQSKDNSAFIGDIGEVTVLTGHGAPITFANGKANQGTNALDVMSTWDAWYISNAKQQSLNPSTSNFLLQAWVYPQGSMGAEGGSIVAKTDAASGYDMRFIAGGGGTAKANVWCGGTEYVVTGPSAYNANRWNLVSLLVYRETPSVDGSVTLYLNGEPGTPATIPAGTPAAVTSTSDFVVGALDTIPSCKFNGLIDEVHLEVGITYPADNMPGSRGALDGSYSAEIRHCYFMGVRNPAHHVRTILASHDFNVSIDQTTWDTAEDTLEGIENGAIVSDMAIVEQRPLGEHLRDILRLRGMRLGLDTAGKWTCVVDTNQSPASAGFGWRDGHYENMVDRPEWTHTALKEAVKKCQLRYRRKRGPTGEIDRYSRKTPPRNVLTVGPTEPVPIEMPALRDETAADIVADYTAKRLKYADTSCIFRTGDDASGLSLGSLVTVLDPTTGIDSGDALATREVRTLVDAGTSFQLDTLGWNADIYTYESAEGAINTQIECVEEDIDIGPEDQPDYAATYPDPVTSVTVSFDANRYATVSWTKPSGPNYQSAIVGWRRRAENPITGPLFATAGTTQESFFVVTAITAAGTYEFQVESQNRHGLKGSPVITEASTA